MNKPRKIHLTLKALGLSLFIHPSLATATQAQAPAPAIIAKPMPIVFWHSMAGTVGHEIDLLAAGFNQSQARYTIVPVYKGEYTDTLTSFVAAYRAKMPPDIVQVFEVGTAIMLYPAGIIKPVNELEKDTGVPLEMSKLPAVSAFYGKAGGLQALPFNTSVPLMFYNADVLAKAGITTPERFPKTWRGLASLAKRLQGQGADCVYTSAYPAWIQLESYAALHGMPLFSENGDRALYNTRPFVSHFLRLQQWQQRHWFEYGGRGNDATALFTSGRCPIFSQSSGAYHGLKAIVPFSLGVAALPIDTSVSSLRHNNVMGGAALWTVSGLAAEKYRGIAQFYRYLLQPQAQERWHIQTGYLPLARLPVDHLGKARPKAMLPTLKIAENDLRSVEEKPNTYQQLPLNQLRDINDEALESVFSGQAKIQEALDEAVKRSNLAIRRFYQNNGPLSP